MANQRRPRVLICAEHQLVRTGMRAIVASQKWIDVVADVESYSAAVEHMQATTPDLVLMDFTPPISTAVETLCHFRDAADDPRRTATRLIVVSTVDDDLLMIATRFGADVVLPGQVAGNHLINAIATLAGQTGNHESAPRERRPTTRTKTVTQAGTAPHHERVARLTPREREILVHVAQGLTNTEIGTRLVLSEATVKTHVTRILTKTGTRHRAEAVVVAFRSGLGDLSGAPLGRSGLGRPGVLETLTPHAALG
ncbi:MAG: response regulator transcription factor [Dermatophilaceae bacterium]